MLAVWLPVPPLVVIEVMPVVPVKAKVPFELVALTTIFMLPSWGFELRNLQNTYFLNATKNLSRS